VFHIFIYLSLIVFSPALWLSCPFPLILHLSPTFCEIQPQRKNG
jgi:hypothetical protein